MNTLWQDVRFGFRQLVRRPGFTAVAVLTLALVLGANTAVFSLTNGVLLKALPYGEPEQLVDVFVDLPPVEGQPGRSGFLDRADFTAWREGASRVEGAASYRRHPVTLTGDGAPERLGAASVSAGLFDLLEALPARGQAFAAGDGRDGGEPVVILAHDLWQRRFAGDPALVGNPIRIDGRPHVVLGVMPESFFFPDREVELWLPLAPAVATGDPAGELMAEYLPVVARLAAGATGAEAEAEAERLLAASATLPEGGEVRFQSLHERMVAEVRPALVAVTVAVALLLFIACVNLANLLLARGAARRREMAVRSAIGGTRGRLVRQVLTENVLLSLLSAALGWLLALWLLRILPRWVPLDLPRVEEARLDLSVFAFTLLLAVATGILFSVLPALRTAGVNLVQPLRGASADGDGRIRSRGVLVIAEVALAVVLLVSAGLLLRSYFELTAVEPGFRPDAAFVATLELPADRYAPPGRARDFYDELLAELERQPTVDAVGIVAVPPLADGFALTDVGVVGEPAERRLSVPQSTSPGYAAAVGLRLVSGRWLDEADHRGQSAVAVVNATFVARFLAGREPLGRQLEIGGTALSVVGVVEDVRLLGLDRDPKPEVFFSYRLASQLSQPPPLRQTVVLRSTAAPGDLATLLRTHVQALDADLPLQSAGPLRSRLAGSVAQPRFFASLLAAFALVALLLSAAGVYGVLAHSVSLQTRAIGIRRALGAPASNVLRLVLGRGMVLMAIGLGLGGVVAVAATRLLSRLLFEVTALDPLAYVVALGVLSAVGLLACLVPAWRAARIDPSVALRQE